jgi:hypothetical protein
MVVTRMHADPVYDMQEEEARRARSQKAFRNLHARLQEPQRRSTDWSVEAHGERAYQVGEDETTDRERKLGVGIGTRPTTEPAEEESMWREEADKYGGLRLEESGLMASKLRRKEGEGER